jgi:predicted regulator of Ras-like GTPase activity (Roadblock/LC7/MglB family)
MKKTLEELSKVTGVTGTMLVSRDGMVILSDLPEGTEQDRVAAMAALVATTTDNSLHKIQRGALLHAMFDADGGKMFLSDAGKGFVVVLTKDDVNVGLIRLEIKTAAERIRSH